MKPVFSLKRFILTKHVGPIRVCLQAWRQLRRSGGALPSQGYKGVNPADQNPGV
jgi:hypothetical protein